MTGLESCPTTGVLNESLTRSPALERCSWEVACVRIVIGFHGTPAFCRALYNANEFVYMP